MSLKKIDQNLARIAATGTKLNALIHQTAMLIAGHAEKHGDCTRALALCKAMPASMRRTTLVAWFTKYTPIRVVLTNDVVGMLRKDDKGYSPFNLAKGDANPFYVIAENTAEEPKPIDFEKLVAMVKAIAKRIDKSVDEGKVAPSDIASAKAISATIESLQFKRIVEKATTDKPARKPKTAASKKATTDKPARKPKTAASKKATTDKPARKPKTAASKAAVDDNSAAFVEPLKAAA